MIAETTVKPQNEELVSGARSNEDAIRSDPENGCFAVADGAGGTGIFSGPWAEYLLKQLPSKPIITYAELADWLDRIWEEFYVEKESELRDDGIRSSKFYREGSASTLLAIWRDKKRVHWMSYGDSNLLWLDAQGKYKGSFPAEKLQDFMGFPRLVNWQDEWMKEKGFRSGILDCEEGDRLLLATDALAQTLLLWANPLVREESLPSGKIAEVQKHFRENPPEPSILKLLKALGDDFANNIQELHQKSLLLNDDCSLVECIVQELSSV